MSNEIIPRGRDEMTLTRREITSVTGVGFSKDEETPPGDRFEVFDETVRVNTVLKNVNRDWTLSNLTDYERRYVIEMSKTGNYVEAWMTLEEEPETEKIATLTGEVFSADYLKRLIISRAKNGLLVKGGILAVIGGTKSDLEGQEKTAENGGGIMSKIPIVGKMFK